jgi:hypothetical protein
MDAARQQLMGVWAWIDNYCHAAGDNSSDAGTSLFGQLKSSDFRL